MKQKREGRVPISEGRGGAKERSLRGGPVEEMDNQRKRMVSDNEICRKKGKVQKDRNLFERPNTEGRGSNKKNYINAGL